MAQGKTFQIDILSDRMYELINKRHLLRCSLCNCLSEASVQLKADKSCVGLWHTTLTHSPYYPWWNWAGNFRTRQSRAQLALQQREDVNRVGFWVQQRWSSVQRSPWWSRPWQPSLCCTCLSCWSHLPPKWRRRRNASQCLYVCSCGLTTPSLTKNSATTTILVSMRTVGLANVATISLVA